MVGAVFVGYGSRSGGAVGMGDVRVGTEMNPVKPVSSPSILLAPSDPFGSSIGPKVRVSFFCDESNPTSPVAPKNPTW